MKTIIQYDKIDKITESYFQYIKQNYIEEFILSEKKLTRKDKEQFSNEILDSYGPLYSLFQNRILNEKEIDTLIEILYNKFDFLINLLIEYDEIILTLPDHYLIILSYVNSKILEIEKFEIAENIKNFKQKWRDKLINTYINYGK